MRRKEQSLFPSGSRGRSLIATRTNQQQRRMQGVKTQLPRSYSSPGTQNEGSPSENQNKGYMMRSFSSPEPKQTSGRRNSETFYRSESLGSRSELDSDLENFEQFDDSLMDIDADNDDIYGQFHRSPERDTPKRVITSLLPGSGLQRIAIRPIISSAANNQKKIKMEKAENKKISRLNFRPLIVKMPSPTSFHSDSEHSLGVEELQTSPQLELEGSELDREFDKAEEHLKREVAMAAAESDNEVSL
ncbi:unnamed protein product, partial [Brenthis ino]